MKRKDVHLFLFLMFLATAVLVLGYCAPARAAFSTTNVPTHVKTACRGWGYFGISTSVPISTQKRYCDWYYVGTAYVANYHAAGITNLILYRNFWRAASNDTSSPAYSLLAPGGKYASGEARNCSGVPVSGATTYGYTYLADPNITSTVAYAESVIKANSLYASFGTVFADNTSNIAAMSNGPPCDFTPASWVLASNTVHATIASALGVKFFLNALLQTGMPGVTPAQLAQLVAPSAVLGAMAEGQYANHYSASKLVTKTYWQFSENIEIAVVAAHKLYYGYNTMLDDPSTVTAQRLYSLASFFVSYDPDYAMYETSLSSPKGFRVMPEQGIVPEMPTLTATDISGYKCGNVYCRQFSACYYRGQYIGKCAVAVNPNPYTYALPLSYPHSVTVAGGSILDGGTLSLKGPARTTLAPYTGAILTP